MSRVVLLGALLFPVVLPDRSHTALPSRVEVFTLRQRRKRRRLCRRRGIRIWRHRRRRLSPIARALVWWTPRVLRDCIRVCAIAVAGLVAGNEPWPAILLGSLLLLCELTLLLGWVTGRPRLLRLALLLDRGARVGTIGAMMLAVSGVVEAKVAGTPMHPAALGVTVVGEAIQLIVEEERVRVFIESPVLLDLPAQSEDDIRLAMVLCRHLFGEDAQELLTHQQIAEAFGKRNRQDCQNQMQKLKRSGGSIAQMILDSRKTRSTALDPGVRALVAQHWERDPLASIEETCRWLASQDLPSGVAVPSPDELRALQQLPGNLVVVRNAVRRLLARSQGICQLVPQRLQRYLLEVLDDQARQMQQAGLQPAAMPGIVEVGLDAARNAATRLSKRSLALLISLGSLTKRLGPEQDEALAASVGTDLLAPLHWALLYCTLRVSIGQVAVLVGKSKSVVYRGLTTLARSLDALDPFPPAARFSGILGLDEKWVKIPKSFAKAEQEAGKKWRYVYFAVDALSGDLLHIEVFEAADGASVRAFLVALRAKGIRPKVVVTDLLAAYDQAIRDTFGAKVLHHYCLFHHLQAVRTRLRERCGKDWHKHPLLRRLVEQVDEIYRCKTRSTARRRLDKVLQLRDELAAQHPEAVSVLETLEQRFPLVANAIGRDDIPSTNNITERTIKAFARHYKDMAGFESLETARLQVALFRFFYRLTPLNDAAKPEHRGLSPLQRAGWCTEGVPLAEYVRSFTTAWEREGPDLLVDPLRFLRPTARSEPWEPASVALGVG